MHTSRWLGVLGGVVGLLVTSPALASSPAGVWSRVDKVVYEPDAKAPTAVRIYGSFLVYQGGDVGFLEQYTPAANGSMYFSCDAKQLDDCRLAWKEIEENITAAEDQCVGFGDQKPPIGTLYPVCQEPKSPEAFDLALGVVSGFTPCQALKEFRAKSGGYPSTCGSGGSGGSVGTGGSAGSGGTEQGGSGGSSGSTQAGSGGTGQAGTVSGGSGGSAGTGSGGDGQAGSNTAGTGGDGQGGDGSGGTGGDGQGGTEQGGSGGSGGSSAGSGGTGQAGQGGSSTAGTSSGGQGGSGQAGTKAGGSGGSSTAGSGGSATAGSGGSAAAGKGGSAGSAAGGKGGGGGSPTSPASDDKADSEDDGGCSASGRVTSSGWPLGVVGLAWVASRLRRRRAS